VSSAASSEPTGRLEAFSDGVIAIAITLLVIEVRVPEVEQGLARALLDQWPRYVSYVVSFLTIGIAWVNHHALFARIHRVTRALLFLNLLVLMAVAFLPFPTALLGEYLAAGHDQRAATVVYTLNMTAINVAFAGIWVYLIRRPQLVEAASGVRLNRFLGRSAVSVMGSCRSSVEPAAKADQRGGCPVDVADTVQQPAPAEQRPGAGEVADRLFDQRAQSGLKPVVGALLVGELVLDAPVSDRGMPVLAGLGHAPKAAVDQGGHPGGRPGGCRTPAAPGRECRRARPAPPQGRGRPARRCRPADPRSPPQHGCSQPGGASSRD
jgi:uncharacterized membrane protein